MATTGNKRALGAAIASAVLLMGALSACNKTPPLDTLLSEAAQFERKGDYKAAIIQLKNAVQQRPEDVKVRVQLANVYNASGDAVSAEKEIRKAISLGMDKNLALPVLGKALLAQGEWQKLLDAGQQGGAASAEVLSLRGAAYLGLGKPDEARAAFEQALALKPDHVEALTGMARQALAGNDVDSAKRYADQAVDKNPSSVEAWLFKGELERALGQADAALAAYGKVLALNPDNVQAHMQKAYLLIGQRQFDAARGEIATARKLAPGNLLLSYTAALLEFSEGKNKEALESLQSVLRAAPEHMPSVLLAGAVQLALGSLPQAEQHLRKYLDAVPSNTYARKLLATALLNAARPKEALAVLAPALKDCGDDVQLLTLAGKSHMGAQDYAKATEYFEKAAGKDPKAAGLRTSLGLSRLAQGERERGLAELEAAAGMDATSAEAGLVLAMTALRLKDYDKVLATVASLEKGEPNNPLLPQLKGSAWLGKKDAVKARAAFERSLALQAAYFPAVASLAQLDVAERKPDAAKARLEAFLAQDKKNLQALNALARLAATQGQQQQATQWLEKAQAENPEAVAPAIQLAGNYLANKQPQKALTLIRQTQVAHPADIDVLDMLGQAQMVSNDAPGALETYSKLAALRPKMAQVQLRLASVYAALKNDAATDEALKKALALQPDLLPAQLAQAQLAARRGKPEQALAVARQMQKQAPNAVFGLVLEGDLLQAQQKLAPALAAYEQAYARGKSAPLLIKQHQLLLQLGRGKEAETRMAQWHKEQPGDPVTGLYLAEGALARKQNKLAIEQLETVLKRHPDNAAALNNLAWAYQQEKDGRALATAERALQVAGNSAPVMDTLGWILVEQGDTARGLALLQKAVALAPDAPEIRYHLALAYQKAGDKPAARKELESLLAAGTKFEQQDEARLLLKRL